MHEGRRRVLGLLVVLLASLGVDVGGGWTSASPILAAEPPELVRRLFDEGIVVFEELGSASSTNQRVIGYVIFDPPPERVFRLLTQTGRQAEFRPELQAVETVAWFEHGNVDEHRIRIVFHSVAYRIRYRWDEKAGRISWELDPDFENDLEHLEGSWELYALEDGRTLGRIGTVVDVGPAVPSFLEDFITRNNLPETIERCRRWVNSDGRERA